MNVPLNNNDMIQQRAKLKDRTTLTKKEEMEKEREREKWRGGELERERQKIAHGNVCIYKSITINNCLRTGKY